VRILNCIPEQFIDLLDQLKEGLEVNVETLRSMLSNPMCSMGGLDLGKFDLGSLGLSLPALTPLLSSFSCGDFDFGFECRTPQPVAGEAVHDTVRCDVCNVHPIVGPRYTCTVCRDFDLCAKCEATPGSHPAEHALLKIRQPANQPVVHAGITCDGCQQSPIAGIRFKCKVCPDFDLCATCEAKNTHPADHPLVKFKVPKTRCGRGGHGMGMRGGHGPMRGVLRELFGRRRGWWGEHSAEEHSRPRWLTRGSVGDTVKQIQQTLNVQPVDGFFGPRTEQAVKEYQTANGLQADGVVGRQTWAKLFPEADAKKCETPTPTSSADSKQEPEFRRRWLARGAVGELVKQVQQLLEVPVDGFFGPRTEKAVKDFQASNDCQVDGVVGRFTWAKMFPDVSKEPVGDCKTSSPSAPKLNVADALMEVLVNMGFQDTELNSRLLEKHNGELEQVVAEIFELSNK